MKLEVGQIREWSLNTEHFILLCRHLDDSGYWGEWDAFSFTCGEYRKYRESDLYKYSTLLSEESK